MVRQIIRRGAIAGATVIGLEAAYAMFRPAPRLPDFDPSGEFGDPSLPTLRVAVLGDSSVTAPGVAGPHEIWVSLICTRLAKTRHVVLQSFAIGGSKADDVIDEQLPLAISFQPDVIFVSVGANDAIKGVALGRFEENLDFLIGELAATGAKVIQSGVGVLGTIPRLYPPLSTLMSRRAHRFDRVHWKVAQTHGTTVVDQRSDDPKVWNSDRSLWAEDFFHVSAAGHARWAETVWRAVDPLFNGAVGHG
jgi:lysophospholipase L1-like esterase